MSSQDLTPGDPTVTAFDIQEAARRLGVGERMIRRLIETRRISHRKVGRLVRFTQADLDEYLDAHKREKVW